MNMQMLNEWMGGWTDRLMDGWMEKFSVCRQVYEEGAFPSIALGSFALINPSMAGALRLFTTMTGHIITCLAQNSC